MPTLVLEAGHRSVILQPFLSKVGALILVCDLLWTPKIKDIVNTKHMVNGPLKSKDQVEAQYDLCAQTASPPYSTPMI